MLIQKNAHDPKVLFKVIERLSQWKSERPYPSSNSNEGLANAL